MGSMARVDALTVLKRELERERFFAPERPVVFRTAHGCLDVLGALGAEAGGTLAQMALPAKAAVAGQLLTEPILRLRRNAAAGEGQTEVVELSAFAGKSERELVAQLAGREAMEWVTPWVALWWILWGKRTANAQRGAALCVQNDIPGRAGQGASKAMLAAAARVLRDLPTAPADATAEDDEEAQQIARAVAEAEAIAERARVGGEAGTPTPSRLHVINALTAMDARGLKPHILRFSAQPHRLVGPVPLPKNLRVLALDTGVRNPAQAGPSEELRTAAAMGTRIIETIYRDLGQQHTPLNGYLANVSPLLYRQYFRALLPKRLRGSDFVRTYGGAAAVAQEAAMPAPAMEERDAGGVYRVRTAVDHLIAENEHAEQFLQAMEELADDDAAAKPMDKAERGRTLARAGRLLLASHHSYRLRLELSCREADFLVDHLMLSGPEHGVYGARITAGGGGGTVAALLDTSAEATDVLLETINSYREF